MNLGEIAARLGCGRKLVNALIAHGWLTRTGHTYTHADVLRLVQDRRCWLAIPRARIADPVLRSYALAVPTYGARWWWTREIAAHHHMTASGIGCWRRRHGWPNGGEWCAWHDAYALWCVTPPAPPPITTTYTLTTRRQRADERRATIMATVRRHGDPRHQRIDWHAVAAELDMHPETLRRAWRRYVNL